MSGEVWLMRHAEREAIPDGEVGMDVGLTPAGRAGAVDLGASLGGRLRRVVSSPVPRCVATAEHLVSGASVVLEVETSTVLGAPGAFVQDGEVAWAAWQELGNEGVIRHLASDEALRAGFRRRQEALGLLAGLVDDAMPEDGVAVLVTHDAVLGPALSLWMDELVVAPACLDFGVLRPGQVTYMGRVRGCAWEVNGG